MQYFRAIRIGLYVTVGCVVQGPVLAESKYPAAYFEPYIVYQAPEIAAQRAQDSQPSHDASNAVAEAQPEASDPYPAAYFEPLIVYQDANLIAAVTVQSAAQSKPAPGGKTAGAKRDKSPAAAMGTPIPAKDRGGVPGGVIVLLLALGGGLYWYVFKKQDKAEPVESPVSEVAAAPQAPTEPEVAAAPQVPIEPEASVETPESTVEAPAASDDQTEPSAHAS